MQVHEAAAVVESGGDAGVEWRPAAASTRAVKGQYTDRHRQQRGEAATYERGRLADGRGVLLPCLPVKRATLTGVEVRHGERRPTRRHDGYSLSKSICDLRTSTRAPYVFAAPVRGRKVVYPRGCTARPVSRLRTAVSSADRVEVFRGESSSPHTAPMCLGVRGPCLAGFSSPCVG